jgi:hypothetical protein
MKHRKFADGTLVVVNFPTHPDSHGFLGLFKFQEDRQCDLVQQGCTVLMMEPQFIEEYRDYLHGKPSMIKEF